MRSSGEEASLQNTSKWPFHSPRSLARFLYAQRVKGFEPAERVALDEDALSQFLGQLKCSSGYLEFGSGGSTLAAGKLGVRTLSVEGDRWYAEVTRKALGHSAPVEILDVDIGLTREWSYPVFTRPTPRRLAKWRQYVAAPFNRLAELGWFPEFVLVDGRFRKACVLETARRAAIGRHSIAMMVDDYFNTAREHYHEVEQWLGPPKRSGRAALFDLSRGNLPSTPSEEDVSRALKDYR